VFRRWTAGAIDRAALAAGDPPRLARCASTCNRNTHFLHVGIDLASLAAAPTDALTSLVIPHTTGQIVGNEIREIFLLSGPGFRGSVSARRLQQVSVFAVRFVWRFAPRRPRHLQLGAGYFLQTRRFLTSHHKSQPFFQAAPLSFFFRFPVARIVVSSGAFVSKSMAMSFKIACWSPHGKPQQRQRAGDTLDTGRPRATKLGVHKEAKTKKVGRMQHSTARHTLWSERHRFERMEDMVGDRATAGRLREFVQHGQVPHLLLVGPSGTGKTSSLVCLAKAVLGTHFASCHLELNASDSRGIETIRGLVRQFISKKLPHDGMRYVILDEADSMPPGAQRNLAVLIDTYSKEARFGLACNDSTKIVDTLQSRCTIVRFEALLDRDMEAHLRKVLQREHYDAVTLSREAMAALLFVAEGDMRKALNSLQALCTRRLSLPLPLTVAGVAARAAAASQEIPPATSRISDDGQKENEPRAQEKAQEQEKGAQEKGAQEKGAQEKGAQEKAQEKGGILLKKQMQAPPLCSLANLTADHVWAITDEPHPCTMREVVQSCVRCDLLAAIQSTDHLWAQGFQSGDVLDALHKVLKRLRFASEPLRLEFLIEFGALLARQSRAVVDGEVSLLQMYGLYARWCRCANRAVNGAAIDQDTGNNRSEETQGPRDPRAQRRTEKKKEET